MKLHWHIIDTPNPWCTLICSWCCTAYEVKHIMMCISHYSIIQSISTALKILYVPLILPLPSLTKHWQPIGKFLLSLTFVFSWISYSCNHIVCSLWLLLLSKIHLRFLHGLIAHLFLVLNNIPLSEYTKFIYPFTCRRTSWLFLSCDNCE